MDVWMNMEVLAPSVENGKEADLSAEVFGVGRDPAQCLGYGAEQDVVDDSPVLQGDRRDHVGYGKDNVEVSDRQQLGAVIFEPLRPGQRLALRAMTVPDRNCT